MLIMSSYNPFDQFEDTSTYDLIELSDCSDIPYELICDKCNSQLPTETQLKSHKITCTGRRSFTRLGNNHPEYHPEKEVLWIISKYIDKQMSRGKNNADMPIGSKYLPYAESIHKSLKTRFSQVEFHILYKTENQIVIRCSW